MRRKSSGPKFRNVSEPIHRGDLTISEVSRALGRSLRDHHHVRPHQAIGLLTPAEFADKAALAA